MSHFEAVGGTSLPFGAEKRDRRKINSQFRSNNNQKDRMDKNSNQYESIKQKLLKLQALAEKGYRGEADAAKRAIERICAQYGVTLEEVLCVDQPQRYEFEIGRYKYMLTLFCQCHGVVTGIGQLSYYKRSRNRIAVDLTPLQYAELSSLFEWHKANFLKDLAAMQAIRNVEQSETCHIAFLHFGCVEGHCGYGYRTYATLGEGVFCPIEIFGRK